MNIFENKFLKFSLPPLAFIYGLVIRIRNRCYDLYIFPIRKIQSCKVISVGNISVGGTGKTPFVSFLARFLKNKQKNVVILSRGYGRKSKGTVIVSDGNSVLASPDEAGDEPYLLARQLSGTPVVVEGDRIKGAQFILDEFEPDIILLDDAFQHRRIARDLDILLMDASQSRRKMHLLPFGVLREPFSSVKRGDIVCLTKVNQTTDADWLQSKINKQTSAPIILCSHEPCQLVHIVKDKKHDLSYLKDKNALLFSGIAKPDSFQQTVQQCGAKIIRHLKFSDHFQYKRENLEKIHQLSKSLAADLIITTEKDAVRITKCLSDSNDIFYLSIHIKIIQGQKILEDKIERTIQ